MTIYNHDAIRRAYPNAVTIEDGFGVKDANGNQIEIDQALVDTAAIEVALEQAQQTAQTNRVSAYRTEADPLFFQYQAGEVTKEEWLTKREEIRARYPDPS
jgi:hypothetical protein